MNQRRSMKSSRARPVDEVARSQAAAPEIASDPARRGRVLRAIDVREVHPPERDPAASHIAAPTALKDPVPRSTQAVEARVDGKRLVLEAENEIVLRCGAASITLTRDGKILVRGTYVETHSRGVNRIKGGAVRIN